MRSRRSFFNVVCRDHENGPQYTLRAAGGKGGLEGTGRAGIQQGLNAGFLL